MYLFKVDVFIETLCHISCPVHTIFNHVEDNMSMIIYLHFYDTKIVQTLVLIH